MEAEGSLVFLKLRVIRGNFDQKAYYQRQNIHGKVWSETLRITDHTVKRIQNVLENIRVHCRNTLLSEAGEKNGSILSTILLGEKSQMNAEIKKTISGERNRTYNCNFRCLFSVLGISNRRKNGLKWAFVSIKFRKNTYFNCAFMHCFAPESDLKN